MSVVVFIVKWLVKALAFAVGLGHKVAVSSIEQGKELYPEVVKASKRGYRSGVKFKFELPDVSDDSDSPEE